MAGVGMAFHRSILKKLKDANGFALLNETALTEDYSLSKKLCQEGIKIGYVDSILVDENKKKGFRFPKPLCKDDNFISN